eukprot:scaffold3720_cov141-Cylindrotheca_fusiformis.AAC.9
MQAQQQQIRDLQEELELMKSLLCRPEKVVSSIVKIKKEPSVPPSGMVQLKIFGIKANGKPCKRCLVQEGYCYQHECQMERRSDPAGENNLQIKSSSCKQYSGATKAGTHGLAQSRYQRI